MGWVWICFFQLSCVFIMPLYQKNRHKSGRFFEFLGLLFLKPQWWAAWLDMRLSNKHLALPLLCSKEASSCRFPQQQPGSIDRLCHSVPEPSTLHLLCVPSQRDLIQNKHLPLHRYEPCWMRPGTSAHLALWLPVVCLSFRIEKV